MQFGKHMYDPEALKNYGSTPFEETVTAVGDLLASGKIKQWGLSNENTYGVTMMCETAKRLGVALPVSIQNDYSITDRCGPARDDDFGYMPRGTNGALRHGILYNANATLYS